jgi:hypothetical protein
VRQSGATEVDAVAAHGYAFSKQELALQRALRDAPVGPHDPMPRETVMRDGEDASDEARRARVDVGVRSDEALRDRAHACEDTRGPGLATVRARLSGAGQTGAATSTAHRQGA